MKIGRCNICGSKMKNGGCPSCGWKESYQAEHATESSLTQKKEKKHRKKGVLAWSVLSVTLIIFPALLNSPPLEDLVSSIYRQQIPTAIPESQYENVSRELKTDGDSVEITVDAGNYIVGVDIPEGIYKISVTGTGAGFSLGDEENEIEYFEGLSEDSEYESSYLENVRLYDGATFRITDGSALFTSSNAQVDALKTLPPNEVLETYQVEDGAVAGADFLEGTYDIVVDSGNYGRVNVSYPDRYLYALGFYGTMGTGEREAKEFKNVEFPKGAMLEISDIDIILVPSVRNSLVREEGGN